MKIAAALIAAALAAATAWAQVPQTSGEVTKIDKATNRVTIRHAEIKHLDMPPMTMVFRVRDPKALEGVAAGDKVMFTAEKLDGNYTVTSLAKVQ